MKLMDLEYAASTYPDEIEQYEAQLQSKPVFDAETLRDLFHQHNLHQCIRSFGEYNRLFNKNKSTSNELNLDTILDNISL
jgi:hypothetical protein